MEKKRSVGLRVLFTLGLLNGLFLFIVDLGSLRIILRPSLMTFIELILVFSAIGLFTFWFRASLRKPAGVLLFGLYLILLGFEQFMIRLTVLGGIIYSPTVTNFIDTIPSIILAISGIIKFTLILSSVMLILGGVFVLRFKDWARRLSVYTCCYCFLAIVLLIPIELIQGKETLTWFVITTLGNMLNFGLPIIYLTRPKVKEQFK